MADANTEKAESIIRKLRRRLYRALGIKRHKWAYERQPLVDLTRLLGGDFRRSPFESPIDLRRDLARYGIVARGIIHVGAHRGTEVDLYRAMGFQDVLFVEANPQLIPDLQALASRSPGVRIAHAAITDHNGSVRLRLTSMDQSSSILPLKYHRKIYPGIREVGFTEVPARTLDQLLVDLGLDSSRFNVLALDIQGAELQALRGAPHLLRQIEAVLTEFSTVQLYEGCALLPELDTFLGGLGLNRCAQSHPWHPTWGDALFVRRPAVSMTTLGSNGRFGNQLFQYAFLKLACEAQRFALQVPDWMGRDIFGLDDPPPVRPLPRVRQGGIDLEGPGPFLAHPERWLTGEEAVEADCDLWGYFQLHGAVLASRREAMNRMFEPVPALAQRLNSCVARLRSICPSVTAIHVRRGDFGYGPFFRAPSSWYAKWLDTVAPVSPAYLASDEPSSLCDSFKGRRIITARDVSDMPAELDWLLDFHVLRQAEQVAISNSSFSFMAALLNQNLRKAGRPCVKSNGIIDFDPCNAPVLLRAEMDSHQHASLTALDAFERDGS